MPDDERPNLNTCKAWAGVDIRDLKASIAHGDTLAAAVQHLCRTREEVRDKAEELVLTLPDTPRM
jgi:hypothetical protein